MTNFEKWRDSLTPEETANDAQHHHIDCDFCPVGAAHECDFLHLGCYGSFIRWANELAEEEE